MKHLSTKETLTLTSLNSGGFFHLIRRNELGMVHYAPNFEKAEGLYCFGLVRASVRSKIINVPRHEISNNLTQQQHGQQPKTLEDLKTFYWESNFTWCTKEAGCRSYKRASVHVMQS